MIKFTLMAFSKSKNFSRLIEAVTFFCLLLIHLLCLRHLQKFDFYGGEGPRWLSFFISPLPVLFLYFLLRVFVRPVLAGTVVAGLEILLSFAHLQKLSLLNEALVWSDISQWANYSIVLHYLRISHSFLILGVGVACIFAVWLDRKVRPLSKPGRLAFLLLSGILYPSVFYSSLSEGESEFARILKHHLWINKIGYFVPDWKKNVKLNGLPYHLVHTSGSRLPKSPTEDQREVFIKLANRNVASFLRPRKVIYVLCESCWHNQNTFVEIFKPLSERGFKEFRAISPVYGGFTANAAFEMMTGLPSRTSSLSGVIYQEYAFKMGKRAHALPRYMAKLGYSTIAVHNHDRNFWHRNIINPKFGFESFIGLQDMKLKKPANGWTDDSLLYESALQVLKEKKDDALFLYLTTVYSHGPYEERDDLGVSDFKRRMTKAIQELTKFVDQVSKSHPDALILVFGDHKPSLNQFFSSSGILTQADFDNRTSWDRVGDVPVYIRSSDQEKTNRLVKEASGLPFFCVTQKLDREFLQSGVPAFNFTEENKLCSDYQNKGYKFYKTAYPDWIFALSIFSDGDTKSALP